MLRDYSAVESLSVCHSQGDANRRASERERASCSSETLLLAGSGATAQDVMHQIESVLHSITIIIMIMHHVHFHHIHTPHLPLELIFACKPKR